jgi:prepilin-type N-terminal cleavage/methylation domain-containing protein
MTTAGRMTRITGARDGFTLIEIIAVVVILSIVGAAIFAYFGQSLINSALPFQQMTQTLILGDVIENMTADYNSKTLTLDQLRINIGTIGTSYTNNRYGTYKLIENRFYAYTTPPDLSLTGVVTDILMVTVENTNGEQLTTLFK